MTSSDKAKVALMDHSRVVAGWSNANQVGSNDLYYYRVDLCQHRDGQYFVRQAGGAAMVTNPFEIWISEEDARTFLRNHAIHHATGFAYTEEEVDQLMAGQYPRAETRPAEEVSHPDFWNL